MHIKNLVIYLVIYRYLQAKWGYLFHIFPYVCVYLVLFRPYVSACMTASLSYTHMIEILYFSYIA